MFKNIALVFSIIAIHLFSNTVYGNDVLHSYLISIKNQDYLKAQKQSNLFENRNLKLEAFQLSEVLYLAGQEQKTIDTTTTNTTNEIATILKKLKLGYYGLYTDTYESSPILHFNEAYALANNAGIEELKKIALRAILEVFTFEVDLTQSEYVKYIEKHALLESDLADLYWTEIYAMRLGYSDVSSKNDEKSNNLFKKLDSIIPLLSYNNSFKASYYSSKAVSLEFQNKRKAAEILHKKAINIIQNEPFLKFIKFRSLIRLSEIRRAQNKFEEAIQFIEQSAAYKDLSDTLRSNYYLDIYKARNYYGLKEYKKAYEYYERASEENSKIQYKDNAKEIAKLNVKYDTAEKEKQLLISEQENEKQQYLLIGLGSILLLGGFIAVLINRNTKRKQRIAEQQKELEIQKTEKLLKDQEITSINAMIEGQEKERQRLASDLHDSVGATLAAAKLQFNHIASNQDKLTEMQPLIEKTKTLLDEAYTEVRGMAHVKNSGVLAKNGLLPALKKLIKNVSATGTLDITLQDFGLDERIENTLEISIFRIIQELTTNIIKHANATQATIDITKHEDTLSIIVEDNGEGFTPSGSLNKDGMGLGSIERRIEHQGGSMEIDTTLGKGTTILIDIPI